MPILGASEVARRNVVDEKKPAREFCGMNMEEEDDDSFAICSSSFTDSDSEPSDDELAELKQRVQIAPQEPTKPGGAVSNVLSLLKGVRPGGDLAKLKVPVQFNLPKSQLQLYGESVYCVKKDFLGMCVEGKTKEARMLAVVRWHLSTTRVPEFGKAPYNPVLGETHHVSCGGLNVFLEQVCHKPPISALYATDEVKGIRMTWWHQPKPHFLGSHMEAEIRGSRMLHLDTWQEKYVLDSPRLQFRFLPTPGTDWVGKSHVACEQSGLTAELEFRTWGMLGGHSHRVRGEVKDAAGHALYKIEGQWTDIVKCTEVATGKEWTLYDGKAALMGLQSPSVVNPGKVALEESVFVWRDVTSALLDGDWDKARSAKEAVEVAQRQQRAHREKEGVTWQPKHFDKVDAASEQTDRHGAGAGEEWVWQHAKKGVSPAPIVAPHAFVEATQ